MRINQIDSRQLAFELDRFSQIVFRPAVMGEQKPGEYKDCKKESRFPHSHLHWVWLERLITADASIAKCAVRIASHLHMLESGRAAGDH
jgi:hypothetical protein